MIWILYCHRVTSLLVNPSVFQSRDSVLLRTAFCHVERADSDQFPVCVWNARIFLCKHLCLNQQAELPATFPPDQILPLLLMRVSAASYVWACKSMAGCAPAVWNFLDVCRGVERTFCQCSQLLFTSVPFRVHSWCSPFLSFLISLLSPNPLFPWAEWVRLSRLYRNVTGLKCVHVVRFTHLVSLVNWSCF